MFAIIGKEMKRNVGSSWAAPTRSVCDESIHLRKSSSSIPYCQSCCISLSYFSCMLVAEIVLWFMYEKKPGKIFVDAVRLS
jgi:hypothetical protein